jgi:hypothetical protein
LEAAEAAAVPEAEAIAWRTGVLRPARSAKEVRRVCAQRAWQAGAGPGRPARGLGLGSGPAASLR